MFGEIKRNTPGPAGYVDAHEFVHAVQYATKVDGPSAADLSRVPKWLLEGQATFLGLLAVSRNLEEYKDLRRFQGRDAWTAKEISTWLQCACTGIDDRRNYYLGAYATEALSVVYGIPSTMQLVGEILNGSTFDEAIRTVYRQDWNKLRPALASAINHLRQY
jgi:hypothetical protein